MSIGGYVGVNNAPRKIVDMYVGVNNQPRRVVKAYVGDSQNKPRLWWQPFSRKYAFNDDYQQGSTYTFSPTIEPEDFLTWIIQRFIEVCKTKEGWSGLSVFSYVLTNLNNIVSRFMQYKGDNNGIGVTTSFNLDYSRYQMSLFIYVSYTNGNKTARVAESYTEHGDSSKYLWGNESQSSLWATRGEYLYQLYVHKETGDITEYWTTPEWAYAMYCRYLGIKYFEEDTNTYLGINNATNYGIHLI